MQNGKPMSIDIRPTSSSFSGALFQVAASPYARAYMRARCPGFVDSGLHLEIDIFVSSTGRHIDSLNQVVDQFLPWLQTEKGKRSKLTSVILDPKSSQHVLIQGVVDGIIFNVRPKLAELRRLVNGEPVHFGSSEQTTTFAASET